MFSNLYTWYIKFVRWLVIRYPMSAPVRPYDAYYTNSIVGSLLVGILCVIIVLVFGGYFG